MPLMFVRNDITCMHVDAIVNATDTHLSGSGGGDAAIHAAAGPGLKQECDRAGCVPPGGAVATGAYDLPCRYVIHTAGPVWNGGITGERELLRSCWRSCLEKAMTLRCESIAFPLISCGTFGYPLREALDLAVSEVRSFLSDPGPEMTVYIVFYDDAALSEGLRMGEEIRDLLNERGDPHEASELRGFGAAEARPSVLWTGSGCARRKLLAGRNPGKRGLSSAKLLEAAPVSRDPSPGKDGLRDGVDVLLDRTDAGFSVTLLKLIDERGMTDVECYRRANVDRKHFSKIRSDPGYKPSKYTVLAFAFALRLDRVETDDLLRRAGYALSPASKPDLVLGYCIDRGYFDIDGINEILYDHDLPLLGDSGAAKGGKI